MDTVFEIHLENFNSALHICDGGHVSDIGWLIKILEKYGVNPQVYALEDDRHLYSHELLDLVKPIKSHGVHHYYDEKADRSPYFNQEGYPFPPSGGFFFRFFPLWYLKWAINKSGLFWVHPADFDEEHPKLKNHILNFKRHIGLKGSKKKLEKLLQEVKFA